MEFVPDGYYQQNLLFVKSSWLRDLLDTLCLPEDFPTHANYSEADVSAILKEGKVPKTAGNEWEILAVDKYARKGQTFVCQLPSLENFAISYDEKPCFAEILQYVSQANFANNWRQTFKRFSNTLIGDSKASNSANSINNAATYDSSLLEVLYRLYNCPIIDVNGQIDSLTSDEKASSLKNVVHANACLITPSHILVLRPYDRFSVHHMLRFSPAIVENSYLKPLFITYQILVAVNEVHKKGLIVGDISLSDIFMTNEMYVALIPRPLSNLLMTGSSQNEEIPVKMSSQSFQSLLLELKSQFCDKNLASPSDLEAVCDNFLGHAVHLWVTGQLSNFDYILLLNYLSGRTFSNPNHYPVLP